MVLARDTFFPKFALHVLSMRLPLVGLWMGGGAASHGYFAADLHESRLESDHLVPYAHHVHDVGLEKGCQFVLQFQERIVEFLVSTRCLQ